MSSLGSAGRQVALPPGGAATMTATTTVLLVVRPAALLLGRETVAAVARINATVEIRTMAVGATTATEAPQLRLRLLEPRHGTKPLLLLLRVSEAMVVIQVPLLTFPVTVLLLACLHLLRAALLPPLPVPLLQDCRP